MSVTDWILTFTVTAQGIWAWSLSKSNGQNIEALRAQQENLDRLNQAMADHTHTVQVQGGPFPPYASRIYRDVDNER